MTAPTTSTTSLEETLEHITAEPTVWVRVAAVQEDGRWRQRLLEMTSGEPPPSWEFHSWAYPAALFAATSESGEEVANWLRSGRMCVGHLEIELAELMDHVTWERRQSWGQASFEAVEWPTGEARFSQGQMPNEPPGPLVSASDAPSFVTFYNAGACFFWIDRQPVGGALNSGAIYRHQDTRGRINSVRISDDVISVEVEGAGTDGMILELAGDSPGPTQRIWNRHRTVATEDVEFRLTEGLPTGAWVLLRQGAEWIDRRFLSYPWARGDDAGVEVTVEPRTKLEAFLTNREGPQTEFKRQVPTDDEGKARSMKTVCAFANGSGGSLLFGIDDDHDLVGIPAERVDRLKDTITQIIERWVEPHPVFEFSALPFGDGSSVVLELHVNQGTGLYGCAPRLGDVPLAYIRHYATTVKARPAEIEAIVRSRNVSGSGFSRHFMLGS